MFNYITDLYFMLGRSHRPHSYGNGEIGVDKLSNVPTKGSTASIMARTSTSPVTSKVNPMLKGGFTKRSARFTKRSARFTKKWYSIILVFIAFVGIGTLLFAVLEDETFTNAFYYIIMTVTTIGYGDFVPTKTSTKWVLSFYAMFGVILFFFTGSTLMHEIGAKR
jgi:Ion channel